MLTFTRPLNVAVLCSHRAPGAVELLDHDPRRDTRLRDRVLHHQRAASSPSTSASSAAACRAWRIRSRHPPRARRALPTWRARRLRRCDRGHPAHFASMSCCSATCSSSPRRCSTRSPGASSTSTTAICMLRTPTARARYPGLRATRDAIIAGERETRSHRPRRHRAARRRSRARAVIAYPVPPVAAWAREREDWTCSRPWCRPTTSGCCATPGARCWPARSRWPTRWCAAAGWSWCDGAHPHRRDGAVGIDHDRSHRALQLARRRDRARPAQRRTADGARRRRARRRAARRRRRRSAAAPISSTSPPAARTRTSAYLTPAARDVPAGYGERFKQILEYLHSTISEIRRAPKPFIAAVDGIAAAGGFGLAMSCDLVIASSRATFEWAYGKTGLTGAESSTFLLPRLVGLRRAWSCCCSIRASTRAARAGDRAGHRASCRSTLRRWPCSASRTSSRPGRPSASASPRS